MAKYELTGKIKLIMEEQTFPSGFSKREFVVTTENERFPQDVCFGCLKDKAAMLDRCSEGQQVKVSFDISGREYNGRYFVNLNAWKIEPADDAAGNIADDFPPEDMGGPLDDDDIGF